MNQIIIKMKTWTEKLSIPRHSYLFRLLILPGLLLIGATASVQAQERERKMEADGYVWYKIKENGKYGAEDRMGRTLLPTEFSLVYYGSDKTFNGKKAEYVTVYDTVGRCIIPIERKYTSVTRHNRDGYIWYSCQTSNGEGACDAHGNEVISPNQGYKSVSLHVNEEDEIAYFKIKKSAWTLNDTKPDEGACDLNGKEIVPARYSGVFYTTIGHALNYTKGKQYISLNIAPPRVQPSDKARYTPPAASVSNAVPTTAITKPLSLNNSRFSIFAKQYVESRINEWQQKGEFEKTVDWQNRVNEQTRQAKIAELTKEAETQFIAAASKDIVLTYELGSYDADNEVYLLHAGNQQLLVPVPISDAPAFKSSWGSVKKTPKYFIENDGLALSEVTFSLTNGKSYKYSNAASLEYTVAQVNYNFDPIEIPAGNTTNARLQGQQTISKVNLAVGKSNVDTDIPTATQPNSSTFAVIIGNENYQKVSKVPFAANDAKIFAAYCEKTLGLPRKNIRTYPDATYATMLSAVRDIQEIARAYKGDLRVIFYYAGHGIPNERSGDAFLLPVDADGRQTEVCYPLNRLYTELGSMGARSVTVFMDACFSGSERGSQMLASARGVAIRARDAAPDGNMVVFSAASGDETAYPYAEKGHGLFTYFLLKKLQESRGGVTLEELGRYLIDNVAKESIVSNGKSQTPTVRPSTALADSWQRMTLK